MMTAIDEVAYYAHDVYDAARGQFEAEPEDVAVFHALRTEIRFALDDARRRGSLPELRVWRVMSRHIDQVIRYLEGAQEYPDFLGWQVAMGDALNLADTAQLPQPTLPRLSFFQRLWTAR